MARKRQAQGQPRRRRGAPKPPAEPGIAGPHRRVLEGIMRRFAGGLFADAEETPLGQAHQIMYQAFEAEPRDEQIQMARRALEICPDCTVAYVLLAEHARGPEEAADLYRQGITAAERALGEPALGEDLGPPWDAAATRPAVAVARARVQVTPQWTATLGPISSRSFGHNTVWVRDGLGLWDETRAAPNARVLPLVTELRPGVLRFPGGTRAMRYHFDEAIGPLDRRRPQCDTFTGRRDDTPYGLDEFFQVVAAVATAEVTLVSPWVDGTPQEAAALVAYVNADPSSTVPIGVDANGKDWGTAGQWAARRVAHGHPAPYGVPFLEIGNEQYLTLPVGPPVSCGRPGFFRQSERWVRGRPIPTTAADHASQVAVTGRLVRAVDPTIRIGASAYSPFDRRTNAATAVAPMDRARGTGDPWNARLVRDAGDAFDFFILHPYDLGLFPDRLLLAEALRRTVHDLRALDPSKAIAVTEFGTFFHGGTLLNALLTADIIRVSIEERLLMTLRHILIEDRPEGLFARSAAILGPEHRRMPGYFAMRMLVHGLRGEAVPTATSDPDLVALASQDPGGGALAVLLIHRRPFGILPRAVAVALPPGRWVGTLGTLRGPYATAPLGLIEQDEVPIRASGTLRLTMPAFALALVRLARP